MKIYSHFVKIGSRLPIFRSPEQERVLAELFLFAREPLTLSELAGRAQTSMGGVHKEVERLEAAGLVTSTTSGRSRLVEANQASPVYGDLRGLLTKTLGPAPLLREALSGIDGVSEAFIYGSWADPNELAPRDIDLMIIGDPELDEVYDAASSVEAQVGRPVNVAIFSSSEWDSADGAFERNVKSKPKVSLDE